MKSFKLWELDKIYYHEMLKFFPDINIFLQLNEDLIINIVGYLDSSATRNLKLSSYFLFRSKDDKNQHVTYLAFLCHNFIRLLG